MELGAIFSLIYTIVLIAIPFLILSIRNNIASINEKMTRLINLLDDKEVNEKGQQIKTCPECGSKHRAEDYTCTRCGSPLPPT
jgi:uncharacterized paraquat-inducible protein A